MLRALETKSSNQICGRGDEIPEDGPNFQVFPNVCLHPCFAGSKTTSPTTLLVGWYTSPITVSPTKLSFAEENW